MQEQLEKNINLMRDEEIIERISNNYFTYEAEVIARKILKRRGTLNIQDKIEVAKKEKLERDNIIKSKDKNKGNFYLILLIILGMLFVDWIIRVKFGIDKNPPLFVSITILIFIGPILISIYKGLSNKIYVSGLLLISILVGVFSAWLGLVIWIYSLYSTMKYKKSK
jgi:hypothetical protein